MTFCLRWNSHARWMTFVKKCLKRAPWSSLGMKTTGKSSGGQKQLPADSYKRMKSVGTTPILIWAGVSKIPEPNMMSSSWHSTHQLKSWRLTGISLSFRSDRQLNFLREASKMAKSIILINHLSWQKMFATLSSMMRFWLQPAIAASVISGNKKMRKTIALISQLSSPSLLLELFSQQSSSVVSTALWKRNAMKSKLTQQTRTFLWLQLHSKQSLDGTLQEWMKNQTEMPPNLIYQLKTTRGQGFEVQSTHWLCLHLQQSRCPSVAKIQKNLWTFRRNETLSFTKKVKPSWFAKRAPRKGRRSIPRMNQTSWRLMLSTITDLF